MTNAAAFYRNENELVRRARGDDLNAIQDRFSNAEKEAWAKFDAAKGAKERKAAREVLKAELASAESEYEKAHGAWYASFHAKKVS